MSELEPTSIVAAVAFAAAFGIAYGQMNMQAAEESVTLAQNPTHALSTANSSSTPDDRKWTTPIGDSRGIASVTVR